MTQSFEEFLKENKQLHYEEGMIDGDCISVKKLGEWALEQVIDCIKHKGSLRGYERDTYKEIAEACLGKEAVERRLKV